MFVCRICTPTIAYAGIDAYIDHLESDHHKNTRLYYNQTLELLITKYTEETVRF